MASQFDLGGYLWSIDQTKKAREQRVASGLSTGAYDAAIGEYYQAIATAGFGSTISPEDYNQYLKTPSNNGTAASAQIVNSSFADNLQLNIQPTGSNPTSAAPFTQPSLLGGSSSGGSPSGSDVNSGSGGSAGSSSGGSVNRGGYIGSSLSGFPIGGYTFIDNTPPLPTSPTPGAVQQTPIAPSNSLSDIGKRVPSPGALRKGLFSTTGLKGAGELQNKALVERKSLLAGL